MHRRDALKTIGVTGTALATLNGEVLAKTAEPKPYVPTFTHRLGWFGEVKCEKPFDLKVKRASLKNWSRGYTVESDSFGWGHYSDWTLKYWQKDHPVIWNVYSCKGHRVICNSSLKGKLKKCYPHKNHICKWETTQFVIHPKPKYVHVYYMWGQAIIVHSWNWEPPYATWLGLWNKYDASPKQKNWFRVTYGKEDGRILQIDFELTKEKKLRNQVLSLCRSGFNHYDKDGNILMTIDVLQDEDHNLVDWAEAHRESGYSLTPQYQYPKG